MSAVVAIIGLLLVNVYAAYFVHDSLQSIRRIRQERLDLHNQRIFWRDINFRIISALKRKEDVLHMEMYQDCNHKN